MKKPCQPVNIEFFAVKQTKTDKTHQICEKLLIRKFEKDRNPRGISYYSYQFYCKMDLSAMAEDDNNITAQTAFCVTHNRKIVGFHFLLVKVLRLLLLRL